MVTCAFAVFVFIVPATIAALIVAGKARSEAREAKTRITALEFELNLLRRGVRGEGTETPVETVPAVGPEPAPAVEEAVAEAPAPSEPVTAETIEPPTEDDAEAWAPVPTEPPSPPPSEPKVKINWEQWLGVRGAAVLGGVVLALAALLFVKFSIERGLIPPVVRVALGVLAGIAALVGSDWLRKRNYMPAGNSLAGAGIVALYASIWAAQSLYALIPTAVAFAFMLLVTVVCGLLAWRHESLVIAVLGLVGGFSTPMLLATGQDRPIGLFGYILLLDVGLLLLARYRGWPVLTVLSLAATVLYQARWIFGELDAGQSLLALAVIAIFAALYAASARLAPAAGEDPTWRLTSVAGVMLPFAFALHIALRADMSAHLWPVALLLAFLAVAAIFLSRTLATPTLAVAAAAAVVGVFIAWMSRTAFTDALAWEAVAIGFGLALLFHLLASQSLGREGAIGENWTQELSDPALLASGGMLLALVFSHLDAPGVAFWPWLCGWLGLAGLLFLQGANGRLAYRRTAASLAVGAGFVGFLADHGGEPEFPALALFFGVAIALAIGLQVLALRARATAAYRYTEYAAATFPIVLLLGILGGAAQPPLADGIFLATTLLLALLTALAATRGRVGPLYVAAGALLVTVHSAGVVHYLSASNEGGNALLWLAVLSGSLLLFTFWPFLASKAFAADRWVLYGSALAAPAWFFALRRLFVQRFGDGAIGVLPVALGLISLSAALLARRSWSTESPERKRSLVWFLAVALGFITLAIPLQLDKEWVTIGWALQGAGMLALWKRLDHPGLKYFGLGLLAVVSVRLIANPEVLDYYGKAAWPVVNWLMYTYLVPAAALLTSSRLLADTEVARLRPWEASFYIRDAALGAYSCGFAAILVIFVWINLTILDYFSPGGTLSVNWERLPARDLTISLAWTIYAVLLLSIGMARKSVGLRWVSLAFLILTIAKVFLYDLGELKDLYRVASLVGLALSLLAVSLAYQRFVFPMREKGQEAEEE